MKTPPYDWTFRRIAGATLVFIVVALCFWLIYSYYQVIFILFIAIAFGTVIRPVVAWFSRRGIPQVWGGILLYFLLFIFLIGFLLLLFPMIAEQIGKISAAMPEYYQSLRVWMVNNPNQIVVRLSNSLPWALPSLLKTQQTGQQVLVSAEQGLSYLASAVNILFMIVAILVLSFQWMLNGPRTIQLLLLLVPDNKRETISELISAIETKVGYFIAGQGVLCLVIAAMALILYLLIGLPNAFVLALVAGVLEAVPMVGPILGAVPAAVIALSISPIKLIWVVVGTVVIQQAENNLLVPRIMRKAVGVNPFVSLLAIFAFSSLFGILGALMAIPFAAVVQLLLDRFVFNPVVMVSEVSSGRDYASRLRYEAQDLAQDLRKQARFKKTGSDKRVKQIDQIMDEIEEITTDLDVLLAQVTPTGKQ